MAALKAAPANAEPTKLKPSCETLASCPPVVEGSGDGSLLLSAPAGSVRVEAALCDVDICEMDRRLNGVIAKFGDP